MARGLLDGLAWRFDWEWNVCQQLRILVIEYGLIAALIGVVIIAGITSTGSATEEMYNHISDTITTATSK